MSTGQSILNVVEMVVVPFSEFVPLMDVVSRVLEKVVDLYHTAQHNKKITELVMQRIAAAQSAIKLLREDDLYSSSQYANLYKFTQVLKKMETYCDEITQYNKLRKYLIAKSIESRYKELCGDYDSCIDLLNLTLMVDFKVNTERDSKILKEEVEEVLKFQKALAEGVDSANAKLDTANDQLDLLVKKVSEMQITMQNLENEKEKEKGTNQKKIDEIFNESPLPYDEYREADDKPRSEKLRKYTHIRTLQEYAFKTVDQQHVNQVKNQVAILKKIKDCQSVIRFYGFTKGEGDKYYLVTEWAENGNLREYYTNRGQDIDIELRLRFAYDIAKGLNFLNAVKILHRDIKSDNVIITGHNVAKITNFKLSRGINEATGNLAVDKESVRHNSPEMLRRGITGEKKKYDTKCEVYSFGILLWEIAECKVPYSQFDDFMEITKSVINGYREPFTDTGIPESYKSLAKESVAQKPGDRPTFAKMLTVLQEIHNKFARKPQSRHNTMNIDRPKPPPPTRKDSLLVFNWESLNTSNILTLDKAIEENKNPNADKAKLYKCFNSHASIGNLKAKYWKAYYITKGWSDLTCSQHEKSKIAAELFKEVADYGDEFPDAQLRYALMVTHGKGVEKNMDEAIEYLVRAAKNGQVVAMFNVATFYFSSENDELGNYYMIMAANKKYPEAIKYCKDHKISLS